MTRHIHIDPVGGIAGDMFVAAMLDAFPENQSTCWNDVETAGLTEHVIIELSSGLSQGLVVKRFQVKLRDTPAKRTGRYADLRVWLEQGDLAPVVKARALAILHLLAVAEAQVHGVPVDDVHFHEIADWDSLVDVVAVASLIERSAIDSWSCAPLPLGSGTVNTEHGELPVPAPATLKLLEGFPVWDDGDPGERVTPTGAAIVRHLFTGEGDQLLRCDQRASGLVKAIGCGAGQRSLKSRPNMVRLAVTEQVQETNVNTSANTNTSTSTNTNTNTNADTSTNTNTDTDTDTDTNTITSTSTSKNTNTNTSAAFTQDEVLEISCDIDDMTPEELAVSLTHIRAYTGVVDASFQLGVGKKGRALFSVVVLCHPNNEATVCQGVFEETTTLGMRISTITRRILKRQAHRVTDEHGTANIKVAERPTGTSAKVESDDLASQPGLQARRLRAQRLISELDDQVGVDSQKS